MRTSALALLAAAALGAAAAHAQWGGWDAEFDENKKDWKEIEAKIPAYPKDGNLLPFEAGAASPHRFFIDAQSLSIGDDGVVRYILVIKTAGGASNVTYEGIRCETRQQKYYALGQAKGTWTRARNPQWRRIEYQEVNRHHDMLFGDFLCTGSSADRTPVASVKEMVQRLKYGQPPKIVE
jgi:hypothetical protein